MRDSLADLAQHVLAIAWSSSPCPRKAEGTRGTAPPAPVTGPGRCGQRQKQNGRGCARSAVFCDERIHSAHALLLHVYDRAPLAARVKTAQNAPCIRARPPSRHPGLAATAAPCLGWPQPAPLPPAARPASSPPPPQRRAQCCPAGKRTGQSAPAEVAQAKARAGKLWWLGRTVFSNSFIRTTKSRKWALNGANADSENSPETRAKR